MSILDWLFIGVLPGVLALGFVGATLVVLFHVVRDEVVKLRKREQL